jgi:RNA polymerase sigma factor (sigma-70 family)
MTELAATLVRQALVGDERAWEELVARYSGLLRLIAWDFRLSGEQAADAAQTTWMRLVENIGKVRDPEKLGAWLSSTMRRECIRLVNHQRRERLSGDWANEQFGQSASPDVAVLLAERNALLCSAIEQLPPRQRQVLLALASDPPPSYKEVGSALSMAVGAIGPTRQRALRRLRMLLDGAETAENTHATSIADGPSLPRLRRPRQRGENGDMPVDDPDRRTGNLTPISGCAPC